MRGNQDVDTSWITLEMTWKGIIDKKVEDQIGFSAPDTFCEIVVGKTINFYVDSDELPKFIEQCAAVLLKNKKLIDKLKQKTINVGKRMRKYAVENIEKVDSLGDGEMASILLKIKELQVECVVYGTAVAFADINGAVSGKVTQILEKRKNLEKSTHIYSKVLATPFEKSLTEKAYEFIKNNKKLSNQELLDKFFWLDQGYIGSGLTLEKLKEIEDTKEKEENLPSIEQALVDLDLTVEEKWVFKVSKDLIQIKALRADSRQFLHVLANRIVDKAAKKLKVEPKYLEVLCAEEVVDILRGKADVPNNLKQRYKHSLLIDKDGEYALIVGEAKVGQWLEEHLLKENLDKSSMIKGQVAYPGKVKGRVRLLFTPEHNDKIKEGDILVAVVTSPQLLPAMKRASAFITDMGGITCHAAIVSREMKKPCIVGTRNATQILKDGDIVEVDAKKGIVKKI